MFFFIGGVTPRPVTEERRPLQLCPACETAGGVERRRVDHSLSVFFVPLLTVHRGAPFLACTHCGWTEFDSNSGGGLGGAGRGIVEDADGDGGSKVAAPRTGAQCCAQCGTRVDPAWSFCPFCGSTL